MGTTADVEPILMVGWSGGSRKWVVHGEAELKIFPAMTAVGFKIPGMVGGLQRDLIGSEARETMAASNLSLVGRALSIWWQRKC